MALSGSLLTYCSPDGRTQTLRASERKRIAILEHLGWQKVAEEAPEGSEPGLLSPEGTEPGGEEKPVALDEHEGKPAGTEPGTRTAKSRQARTK